MPPLLSGRHLLLRVRSQWFLRAGFHTASLTHEPVSGGPAPRAPWKWAVGAGKVGFLLPTSPKHLTAWNADGDPGRAPRRFRARAGLSSPRRRVVSVAQSPRTPPKSRSKT